MQNMDYSAYEERKVVLVDLDDNEVGVEDILVAHQGEGKKHRALSVILYRPTSSMTTLGVKKSVEILMQKRSHAKPVFKGLWSNTCCTNLRPGDTYIERAVSRLNEEMGIEVRPEELRILYRFSYEAPDLTNPGWCENEVDTVIVGTSASLSAGEFRCDLNPEEAEDAKWMGYEEMKEDMEKNPDIYSPWHKLIINDPRFVEGVGDICVN